MKAPEDELPASTVEAFVGSSATDQKDSPLGVPTSSWVHVVAPSVVLNTPPLEKSPARYRVSGSVGSIVIDSGHVAPSPAFAGAHVPPPSVDLYTEHSPAA